MNKNYLAIKKAALSSKNIIVYEMFKKIIVQQYTVLFVKWENTVPNMAEIIVIIQDILVWQK